MNSKFVLLTSDGAELFVVKPDYKGNRSTVDCQPSASDAFAKLAHKDLLGLMVVHCAN